MTTPIDDVECTGFVCNRFCFVFWQGRLETCSNNKLNSVRSTISISSKATQAFLCLVVNLFPLLQHRNPIQRILSIKVSSHQITTDDTNKSALPDSKLARQTTNRHTHSRHTHDRQTDMYDTVAHDISCDRGC